MAKLLSPVATKHPCLSCGACCAHYRVSFHWTETSAESHGVPLVMTTQISPVLNAMIGTGGKVPSCIALLGTVGESASCSIYENRPGCCRLFAASFEDGTRNSYCDKARVAKGMTELTAKDWPAEANAATRV